MITYKIIFFDNMGSRAVDALAETVQGDGRNTVDNYDGRGHDLAFLDVPEENAGYLEKLLVADPNVFEYSRQ